MIGIFGGTFDPIHTGHLHIARAVLALLNLQQLQFVPCARPVHRDPPRASAEQRCAMIELAIADQPRLRLNRLEIERGGFSYTVETLRELRCAGDASLVLLLGADAFNGFASWESPAEILELANLVVCLRPAVEVSPDLYSGSRVDSVEALGASEAGAILLLEVDAPDCSSSALRAGLAAERQSPCLPAAVADYILKQHLYRRPGD
jgi:nicotinate-nucleotide adenylyltransferase